MIRIRRLISGVMGAFPWSFKQVPAQRVTLQLITYYPIQPLETLAHVGGSRRQIDPRRRAKAEHRLQPLQHSHQSRQRRCIKAVAHFDPAPRGKNYRQDTTPVLPVTDPPRQFHRDQATELAPALPVSLASSDNDSVCSALPRGCGRIRSPSDRCQQTLPPTVGSPMNYDVDVVPESVLRSSQHFTTTARNNRCVALTLLTVFHSARRCARASRCQRVWKQFSLTLQFTRLSSERRRVVHSLGGAVCARFASHVRSVQSRVNRSVAVDDTTR